MPFPAAQEFIEVLRHLPRGLRLNEALADERHQAALLAAISEVGLGLGTLASECPDETQGDDELARSADFQKRTHLGDLSAATRQKEYVLGEMLGQGQQGVVIAMDCAHGRRQGAILKIFSPGMHGLNGQELPRHAAWIKAIDDPWLLKFQGFELEALAYPRLGGSSVEEYLEKPRELSLRLTVFADLLQAMITAEGWVHLDIKPTNLHLTSSGQIRMIDTDLMRPELALQIRGDLRARTPGYGAPEQFDGATTPPSSSADLFALGLCLFEFATCEPYWHAPDLGGVTWPDYLSSRHTSDGHASLGPRLAAATGMDENSLAPLVAAICEATALEPSERGYLKELHERLSDFIPTAKAFEKEHFNRTAEPAPDPANAALSHPDRSTLTRLATERADLLQLVTEDRGVALEKIYAEVLVQRQLGQKLAEGTGGLEPGPGGGGRTEPEPSLTLDRLLTNHPQTVLLGGAGSGKTTLLRRRAAKLLENWEHGPSPDAKAPLHPEPLLVALRDLSSVPFDEAWPGSEDAIPSLFRWLARWHASRLLQADLQDEAAWSAANLMSASKSGALEILLDGFDELSDEVRPRLEKCLANLAGDWLKEHPKSRWVISSRTDDYQGLAPLLGAESPFAHAEVLPLDSESRGALASKLLDHLPGHLPASLRDQFLSLISTGDDETATAELNPLADLARTPVLLTIMALVLKVDRAPLPEGRTQLYERAVTELIRRFLRRAEFSLAARWPVEQVKSLLGHIAWHDTKTDGTDLPSHAARSEVVQWVHEWMDRTLGVASEGQPQNAEGLVDLLARHSGLFPEPDNAAQRFVHRTIGEYLAAWHLSQQDADLLHDELRESIPVDRRTNALSLAVQLLADPGNGRGGAWRLERCVRAFTASGELATIGLLAPLLTWAAPLRSGQGGINALKEILDTVLLPALENKDLDPILRVQLGDVLGFAGDPRLDGDPWVEVPGSTQFMIRRWPVTVQEYRSFVGFDCRKLTNAASKLLTLDEPMRGRLVQWLAEHEAAPAPKEWNALETQASNRPVTGVSWFEAAAYCLYLASEVELGAAIFLPTADQWIEAVRNGLDALTEDRDYPWRGPWNSSLANTSELGLNTTSAVGCFPGGHTLGKVWDMAGNVWEWCSSSEYGDSGSRAIRGGSFINPAWYAAAGYRFGFYPEYRFRVLGFRPAKGITP